MPWRSCLLLLCALSCASPPPPPAPGISSGQGRLLERTERSAVGSQHQTLDPLVGEWVVQVYAAADQDGVEELVALGLGSLRWILGARYLEWNTSMERGSEQIGARGLLGFDQGSELYELLWCSELTTGQRIIRGAGVVDGAGILFDQPSSTGARLRLRLLSPDHFELRQYRATADGSWQQLTRTEYERSSQ